MLYLSKIMDKLGYEEKDERFIRKFIKECEKSQVYVRKTVSGRNVLTEVNKLDVNMKNEKLLRIKRLEKVINERATTFFIQVHDDGFSIIRK